MHMTGRYLRRHVTALLLGLAVSIAATAAQAQSAAVPAAAVSTAHPQIASVSAIRIENFGRVNDNYYRGGLPVGRDFADLQALGVKTIIDLRDDGEASEEATVQGLGMKFFRIPMTTRETPSAEKLARFLEIVNDPANEPVYVHCQGGRHRTGVMTAVYRMTNEGWSADRAFAEMKQFKFGADFLHPEFKSFVYGYHPPDLAVTAPAAKGGNR